QFVQTLDPATGRSPGHRSLNSSVKRHSGGAADDGSKTHEELERGSKYATVEEAMASLSTLTRRDFIELRNLPSPPEGVLSVARGLCLALGVKPKRRSTTDGIIGRSEAPQDYWKAAREHIFPSSSAISLLQRLVFFDKDRVPERTMRSLAALV
ncbi:hypothetical protein FOZ62_015066, partial [Perkinsus olseni]